MIPRPVQNLLVVRDLVRQHGDPDVVQWFERGIAEYLSGEHDDLRPGRLEHCLLLGGYSAVQSWRYARRNELLADCLALVEGGSDRQRRAELARRIRRFTAGRWTRWRDLDLPPDTATEIERRLFTAAKVGLPLPESASGLQHCVSSSGTCSDTPERI